MFNIVYVKDIWSATQAKPMLINRAHLYHQSCQMIKSSLVRKKVILLLLTQCVYLVKKCQSQNYISRLNFSSWEFLLRFLQVVSVLAKVQLLSLANLVSQSHRSERPNLLLSSNFNRA
jgi:hypothetical protein